MSESFVALRDTAAVQRLNEELLKITHRPDAEKLALMMLRRGNDLAKACVKMGTNCGWPQPRKIDWRNLIACKLVARDERSGFLVLTPLGLMWQRQIANRMAYVAEAHFLCEADTDSRFEISVRCTCGWTASIDKRHSHNRITDQWRAYAQHRDAVNKGIWQPPRRADEVLNEILDRRDQSIVPAQATETVDA